MSATDDDTRAPDPRQAFDTARLEAWLTAHLPGFAGPLSVRQFKGGQSNPTFRLDTPGARYVLRRKPAGKLLASAHQVEREYKVLKALHGSAVPVAKPWLLCEDTDVIGSAFYVMDCVEGRVLWSPTLPGMAPAERRAIFAEMNRVIAALHSLDHAALGLADYGKTGGYLQRQTARWGQQYRASILEPIEPFERLLDWLPQHLPTDERTTLVHGDYRIDNLMFHPTEPRVLAVLDWELSTLGHPLADFANHCMAWHIPAELFRGLGGVDLAALGIPDEASYLAAYVAATGQPVRADDWQVLMVYNLFRLACIAQGIAGRVRDGTAASAQAQAAAASATPLAALAWQKAQSLSR